MLVQALGSRIEGQLEHIEGKMHHIREDVRNMKDMMTSFFSHYPPPQTIIPQSFNVFFFGFYYFSLCNVYYLLNIMQWFCLISL